MQYEGGGGIAAAVRWKGCTCPETGKRTVTAKGGERNISARSRILQWPVVVLLRIG